MEEQFPVVDGIGSARTEIDVLARIGVRRDVGDVGIVDLLEYSRASDVQDTETQHRDRAKTGILLVVRLLFGTVIKCRRGIEIEIEVRKSVRRRKLQVRIGNRRAFVQFALGSEDSG